IGVPRRWRRARFHAVTYGDRIAIADPSALISRTPLAARLTRSTEQARRARSRILCVVQDTVSSHVAVTGTDCLPEPSKDVASARGETQSVVLQFCPALSPDGGCSGGSCRQRYDVCRVRDSHVPR